MTFCGVLLSLMGRLRVLIADVVGFRVIRVLFKF